MQDYDICLAWNCEYDHDFIQMFKESLNSRGLSFLQVNLGNITDVTKKIENNEIRLKVLFNRTYGSEEQFKEFISHAAAQASYCINAYDKSVLAADKAMMHYILIKAGIYTPFTTILPSYEDEPELTLWDLGQLKENFIIKPANGGGGDGVVLDANSLHEILATRQEYPADRYLVQRHIYPVILKNNPAWFRVIYCMGHIYPNWWHPQTHIYTVLDTNDEGHFQLSPLREITQTIAHLTDLDFFSTEIALTSEGHYTVIDYVNDEIDIRLKSKTPDGVPDQIIKDISERIVILVANYCQNKTASVFENSIHS